MTSQAPRPYPRLRRWLLVSLLVYPAWLLLLGPFWALDGRGAIDFLPSSVRRIVYLPAVPLVCKRHAECRLTGIFPAALQKCQSRDV